MSDRRIPADESIDSVVALYANAERELRALVDAALGAGRERRRRLLAQAVLLLAELLRQGSAAGRRVVEESHAAAFRAVGLLLGLDLAHPTGPRPLAGSAAKLLRQAAATTAEHTREVLRAGAPIEHGTSPLEHEALVTAAVTAHVDAAGRRWTLANRGEMLARTLGRQAVTWGTVDGMQGAGRQLVLISSHENPNPVCRDGETITLGEGALPPYHGRCTHVATPAGYRLEQHVAAMEVA